MPENIILLSAAQFSAIDDTLPELTEGFLCYLEVLENRLDLRDVRRIDIFNRLTLVRIQDNDGKPLPIRIKSQEFSSVLPY